MSNLAVPSPVFPEAGRVLNIGREAVAPGTLATTFVSMPVNDFQPDYEFNPFEDNAVRGSLAGPFDLELGPAWVTQSITESPVYGDTIGHVLANLFGEWSDTGTSADTTWTASAAIAAGADSITVSTGTAATEGTYVQVGAGALAEVCTVGADSTTTSIVLSTPTRFAHASAVAITLVTGPFTHTFAVMNPGSPTGSMSGQGPSHTILDRNGIAGEDGYYADAYPYCCFSEVSLTGMPNGYLTWSGKVTSWPLTTPGGAVTPAFSGAKGIPAWLGTSTVGGDLADNIDQWKITLTRELNPVPMINGQQAPYIIARGKLTGTFDTEYAAVANEDVLGYLANNTQPSLAWTTANGLSGSSELSFSLAANLGGAKKAPLKSVKTLFGYDLSGDLIANTTDVGPSGGFGPCTVVLINQIPSY